MQKNGPETTLQSLTLVKETLTQQICKFLKSKILNGDLVAGNRIWAGDLASELGVSIAPVKEALLILSGEGLINSIPRRGSVVRNFSLAEMYELYDMRRLLETEALQIMFAKQLVVDTFVEELHRINERIGRLCKDREFTDRNTAFELDWDFHQHFIQNCQHRLLIELYSRLNTQAQIIRYTSWNIGPRGEKTYNEHGAIVDALNDRDLAKGEAAIRAHLTSILRDFDRAIASESPSAGMLTGQIEPLPSGRRKFR